MKKISELKTAFTESKEFIAKKTSITYEVLSKVISYYAHPLIMTKKEIEEILLGQEFSEDFCILNTEDKETFSKIVSDECYLQYLQHNSLTALTEQNDQTKKQKGF